MALKFDTSFDPFYGQGVSVAPDIQRITARNPSPFTFYGTNSYIVGRDTLAVIDPGPDDEAHLHTLLDVIAGRPVSHIFVSHTHRDHSPLAARLKERTGATVLAEGPHRPARPLHIGETDALDASADTAFVPDFVLPDEEVVDGDGWSIKTVLTPGHTANHAAFALEGTGILFSADHVMAWATSIVAPPDGAMADYMTSLDRLIERGDRLLLPGHGGPVTAPRAFMRGLKTHRKMRERAIMERISVGDRTIADMVNTIYRDTDPRLHGAAGLSVLAHIEDLIARGLVRTDGAPAINGIFTPAA
ncbi:glyoxylase-like metal-dependent hydrolase (beta-lactamase superfamily II) [Mesorhizobium loti]|uniref:Glyoxylase-like metal-dependent hydrolase (Beta-lactamase superfamily II) n=1 Tax=Rhizobium loti TaxID=381 RepID=A0A8E2WEN1_RHILI|nr:MBL fold metallo-hydrolase [Mesorhizobium loti]PWJ92727.1 glyoxylase-like metal-dependent hydrolase (beta-lactamase superfamily II) [Mesorhizobium loti]